MELGSIKRIIEFYGLTMKINAAVVRESGGSFALETLELDEPRADEVLVRISGVGICHTDLICRDQQYPVPLPVVLGHEGSGIVEKVGKDVKGLLAGDPVVLSFCTCGHCDNCLEGLPSRCLSIFESNFSGCREDGSHTLWHQEDPVNGHFFGQSSFASHVIAHQKNTVKVSKDVPIELLGPLGCGIQTGAGTVMNALQPEAGSSIAVFGCGAVGLSAVMAANAVGCTNIFAIDPNPHRLELASELGATFTLNPTEENPVEAIQQQLPIGVDYSIECTGIPDVFRQAVDSLSVTGTCALVGAAPMGTEVSLDMNSIMFGRSIIGVIEGDSVPQLFIPKLVDLYQNGKFPIDKLVTFYSLDEINQAVKDAEQGKVIKAILRP